MRKKGLYLVIAVFYVCMIVLTICSRRVHEASLPKVEIFYPERFSAGKDGEFLFCPGVPKELCDSRLFLVTQKEKNGEYRYYAKEVKNPVFLEERGELMLVKEGIPELSMLIRNGMENVENGSEVLIVNEEDVKAW